MTTVTVVASSADDRHRSPTRASSTATTFSAGDLPVANDVQIDVLLHDDSNRLVGVGEAPNLVDIVGDKATTV